MSTRFWHDLWAMTEQPLVSLAIMPVPQHILHQSVNFFADNSGWRWDLFRDYLPEETLLSIAGIPPPSADAGPDAIY